MTRKPHFSPKARIVPLLDDIIEGAVLHAIHRVYKHRSDQGPDEATCLAIAEQAVHDFWVGFEEVFEPLGGDDENV